MTPDIRTIIADDEPLGRKKLRILLAEEPGIHISWRSARMARRPLRL